MITYLPWNDVDEREPGVYKRKIKVFKRNGDEMMIDEGATVLDFAFAIHSELGLQFDYALMDDSPERIPAYRRLNPGDKVTIVKSDVAKPKISWFKYVKTSKAIDKLVKYFLNKI